MLIRYCVKTSRTSCNRILFQDNGNVEIYDRMTQKLCCVLTGQYSISPVGLDINSQFILVNYTCAFVNRYVLIQIFYG